MEIQKLLKEEPVISSMLRDCPYQILSNWTMEEYPKGHMICEQNGYYEYFYIIVEGYANIFMMSENGKKYSQSVYEKGDYFGELEIFDNKPYICSIETLTDLKVLKLHRRYFLEWVEKDKHFLLHITKTLCNHFYKLSKKAGEDTLYSLKYRVCNYLMYCSHQGIKTDQGIKIQIQKEHLSAQFVVTQRSINRILKYLKEKRIIEVTDKSILIKDIEKLKEEERKSIYE